MPATYTRVSIRDFQTIFQSEKGWEMGSKHGEVVLIRKFPNYARIHEFFGTGISIVVYTGIGVDGRCRGNGSDAIRFVAVRQFMKNGELIEYSLFKTQSRVNRSTACGDPNAIIIRCKERVLTLMGEIENFLLEKNK